MKTEPDTYAKNLRDTLHLIRMVTRLASVESSVQTFADRVCSILCTKKGYNIVWMALWEKGKFGYFTSSEDGEFEHFINRSFIDNKVPKCVKQAIASRRPVSSEDGVFSCTLCSLNQPDLHTHRVIFPLHYKSEFLGVMGCSFPSNTGYNSISEEKELFEEISSDIGFAVNKFQLQDAVKEINLSLENTKKILNNQMNSALIIQGKCIIDVNDIFIKLTGYDRSELIGSPVSNYFSQDEYQRIVGEFRASCLHRRKNKVEIILQTISGSVLHFDSYVAQIALNGLDAYHVKLIDRTHRVGLERELSISRQRMSVLLESLPGIAYVSKPTKNFKFEFISQGSLDLTGYEPAYFEGDEGVDFASVIYEEDREGAWELTNKALQEDSSYELRYRIVTKNGDLKWVWDKGQKVVYGGVVLLEGFIADITRSVQFEEHLQKLNDVQATLLNNVPSNILFLDVNNTIVHANDSLSRLFNVPIDKIIGKDLKLFVGSSYEDFAKSNYQVVSTGIPIRNKLEVLNFEGREPIHLFTDIVPHKFEDNSNGVIIFTTDVSDVVHAKDILQQKVEELKYANKRAKESDRLKSAFLSTLSHEMRTPMNGILGFASLLKNPRLNEEERTKYSRIIKNAGERMLETIDNIVEMSKIKAGLISSNYDVVPVAPILQNLVDQFQSQCTHKGLLFVYDNRLPEGQGNLFVDSNKLFSILSRLLHNSVRFTSKGSILLKCCRKNNNIVISITDTGIGIEQSKLKDIFLPFVHTSTKLSDNQEGSGLGLSIAKAYIELMKGSIMVRSKRNHGSSFSVEFPIADIVDLKTNTTLLENAKKTILVLDDDPAANLYLSFFLEGYSFNVISVSSIEDMVEELESSFTIDMVFLNPMYHKYDRNVVFSAFKKTESSVPFIVHTTSVLQSDSDLAKEFGCSAFLVKPYSEIDLKKAIQTVFKEELIES